MNHNTIINNAFMRLIRRSERAARAHLVDTFVDVGPLFTLLSSNDHQVIFGRRGTGKTHAFAYLAESRSAEGDLVLSIDLSNIGSSAGLYSNSELPIEERASRLLTDTLLAIHERLYEIFVENSEEFNLAAAGPLLDDLADAATEVRVVGDVEARVSNEAEHQESNANSSSIGLSHSTLEIGAQSNRENISRNSTTSGLTKRGAERHSVHFGSISKIWGRLTDLTQPRRTWVLLDEWSSIPLDLQPLLADFLRRSFFSISSVVVKVAAIEQRSRFAISSEQGSYQGIEVGADVAADINLDDFMVFDNDSHRSRLFYRNLIYKHVVSTDVIHNSGISFSSEQDFVRQAFTQVNTFDELVRASEGVPRDAINIAIQAAQYAADNPISMEHVRRAAHAWFQRDKEAAIKATRGASELLHWITTEVIGERRARAFLLRTDARDRLIEALFDSRVLHILKKNVSTHDDPGVRYHVYKLDFGCYVDLMSTARAPQGLLELDPTPDSLDKQYIQVPPDDYRAIRRAILNIDRFYAENTV